ncbi:MAG: potassium transporter Kup [Verrucomicrobia bacterium]|nr:potassium transporter Kup [Verrucomicrobiota bacterium]NBU07486.1 potassium transporter Kup [Pseudomonadota bacterium]NDB76614.1 potassium transporter Kup [Verrucomicrobiota bacterium]
MQSHSTERAALPALTLAALGVVYGDIGTSPLYALKECFNPESPHSLTATPEHVLGVLSLMFWSLVMIVSVKYLGFVMRADNKGEGGILALLSLAFPERDKPNRSRAILIGCGVFGAALLYGDGMITPAISVLSAVEGLSVATKVFDGFIEPITVVILIGLFCIQRLGTGRVGKMFGPVMIVWFAVLVLLGLKGILMQPAVVAAINPWHGLHLLFTAGYQGFVVIGSVFLVVTGGEALYADMGHFGVRPIRLAWFALVLPALFINYLGQGALLLTNPKAVENPFYLLAPASPWALYPLVILSTAATVIASQALISGAYSLTMHAIQLGYLPRMVIRHTSSAERGQIYMPHVNWALMLACIGLVLGFKNSSNLAAAYGIAVTLTMLVTTMLFFFAARRLWNWPRKRAMALCGVFLAVELAFFASNLIKVAHGGWFPLVVGAGIFTVMATWKTGRRLVWERMQNATLPRDLFFADIEANPPQRVSGTAIFMAGNPNGTPVALLHNLKHNKILHQRNILLTIVTDEVAHVPAAERVQVEQLPCGFQRLVGRYGFMEEPNILQLLKDAPVTGGPIEIPKTTFFLSRETVLDTGKARLSRWRKWLFAVLARNASTATSYFGLPANRVVELGMQVEI